MSIPSITELHAAMIITYIIFKGCCELYLTFQYPPHFIIGQLFYYKNHVMLFLMFVNLEEDQFIVT